jgi:VanZ family protein
MENVTSRAHWLWPIGGALAALALSSIPARAVPQTGLFHIDKLVHVAEYAVLGFFFARSWFRHASLGPWPVLFAIACVAGFGMLDESYQRLTPGRDSSVNDMLADAFGAFLGVMSFVLWLRRTNHDHSATVWRRPAPGR